jgi:hypothetical protein
MAPRGAPYPRLFGQCASNSTRLSALLTPCVLLGALVLSAAVRAEDTSACTGVAEYFDPDVVILARAAMAHKAAAAAAAAAVERRRLQDAQAFDDNMEYLAGVVDGFVVTATNFVNKAFSARPVISSAAFVCRELLFRRYLTCTVTVAALLIAAGALLKFQRAAAKVASRSAPVADRELTPTPRSPSSPASPSSSSPSASPSRSPARNPMAETTNIRPARVCSTCGLPGHYCRTCLWNKSTDGTIKRAQRSNN